MKRPDEEGVALLTMLLLVAVMSVLAVSVLDDIRFAVRRTGNAEAVAQAQWYALGAETLAREQIKRVGGGDNPGGWNGQWREFPIDGGMIRAKLDDAGNCFNLNSVVEGAPEYWLRREAGLQQFAALLAALDFSESEARGLAESLADWIDSDGARNIAGAEDDAYLGKARPYRTSGELLAEVSELRAVKGYSGATYARIRPFVCALPAATLSPLNINTLTPEQGVLLTMLTNGALTPARSRDLLVNRPAGGWPNAETFWMQPALAGAIPSDSALGQTGTRTRFYSLTAEVSWNGGEAFMTGLLEDQGGAVGVRARRWTIDE